MKYEDAIKQINSKLHFHMANKEDELDHDCYGIHINTMPSTHGLGGMPDGIYAEKCDAMAIFESDEEAAMAAGLIGKWIACEISEHFMITGIARRK